MGKAIDWETREYAEDLYIARGYTLEQVAAATGVSLSQVKTWSTDDSWGDRREEYRQAVRGIRADTIRLRRELIAKALASKDPQDVYAAAAFERMAAAAEKKAGSGSGSDVAPAEIAREINTPEEAVAAMRDAVQVKVNLMLSRPGEISKDAIKDVERILALIEKMQEQYAPKDMGRTEKRQLDPDTIKRIREEIYGLK